MFKSKNTLFLSLSLGLVTGLNIGPVNEALAQKSNGKPTKEKPKTEKNAAKTEGTKAKTDSTAAKPVAAGEIKPYKDIITAKAKSQFGMIGVHKIEQKFFFEIPDSILGRDILVVNRVAGAPAGLRPQKHVYGGDQIAENVVTFEKGPDNKVFLRRRIFAERAQDSSENGLFKSLVKSNLQPIVAAFTIKAYGTDSLSKTSVIEVTDFLNQENEILYFNEGAKKGLNIGGIQADKSYIDKVQTFPINVEIQSVRTYSVNGSTSTLPMTYALNSSLVLLPKEPMKARLADARVGFFARGFVDFDKNPQGVKNVYYTTRWRLEPKAEDEARYLRGELVEPKKPIVYYIDPATPKKWIPYLIAGVNDWQEAFEAAGFKNAIRAELAPTDDSTWNINDARNSAIVYKPSAIPNASGPHVHDPRSGEIIESHINWYHNIMLVLRNWYMIQAGAIDSRARKMVLDDDLMGELIRFVSSHEVGHTLGLMHNFGSSSTVPVDSLRSRTFTDKYGHTPSIMDYARFNYVAQPEDGISQKGIFPRIGDYDKWAISWGYRWLPQFEKAEDETPYQNKLIIDSLTANKRLFFGAEFEYSDPRSQSEDLGDDNAKANTYGIKNLQRILPNLLTWTRTANEGYEEAGEMYKTLLQQYKLYNMQVMKSVGGKYRTLKSVEQPGPVFEDVPYEKQKQAMKFLNDQLFQTPTWLKNDTLTSLTGVDADVYIFATQHAVLFKFLGSGMISTMIDNTNKAKKKEKLYGINEYLSDLRSAIWAELYNSQDITASRRSLQKIYINQTFRNFVMTTEIVGVNNGNGTIMYLNPEPTHSDASSLMRQHLVDLSKDIKKAIPRKKGLAKAHLIDIAMRIDEQLKKGLVKVGQ